MGKDMGKDKSIVEKFAEAVRGLTDSAIEALNAEEPPRLRESAADYMPLAAQGVISDPLLVPPLAVRPAHSGKKRGAANKNAKRASASTADPDTRKSKKSENRSMRSAKSDKGESTQRKFAKTRRNSATTRTAGTRTAATRSAGGGTRIAKPKAGRGRRPANGAGPKRAR
jgi:hypothetical protein